ncbi:UDP-N-acetylmuramoyl-tripeptide--D-alanyl-D-alanine ligase [Peribacillus tepidiphilus]|uniref:UDP-N-acetylmuramoyl-tripeptide--D-alanyl-D- alanine ligase n=1 Tax=Peribacillus tepidiphilus TaxID=2652445 RepID=UPI001290E64F|nr:UDP-N-acetylmuramoyl-tripeptide--D-alanyl-D-alanine ligase [Peribacillus tepidiphilus]
MIKRSLQEIASMMNGQLNKEYDIEIRGVSIDSRKIEEGNLFIPFKGEHVDGHQYVKSAIEKGAGASLWQKDVPNPPEDIPLIFVEDPLKALQALAKNYLMQLSVKVVGITGSNGKTTTKDMVAALLSTQYRVHKTSGNYNNHIGLPLTILTMSEDTEVAVLEMGMSGRGEIELLSKLAEPDLAIITNIGEAHLLDLGSREGIAEAKLEIMSGLKEDGVLIYHGDEPLLKERVEGHSIRNLTFGLGHQNTVYAEYIKTREKDTLFKTNLYGTEFVLPVLGAHNVQNAMAAILAARELGITPENIKAGLSSVQLTNMRMEMKKGKRGEIIINDAYNASPTSMKAAIDLVTELTGFNRKILVLGDMLELGPKEEEFHLKIGAMIKPGSVDQLFTYGRLGKKIAEGAMKVLPKEAIFSYEDKEELIATLINQVSKNDLILVKASRGMKLEEVVQALMEG